MNQRIAMGGICNRRRFIRGITSAIALGVGGGAFVQSSAATGGEIDVKPGSDPNSFNDDSGGVVPVKLVSCGGYRGEPVPGTNAIVDTLYFGPPREFTDDGNINVEEIEQCIADGDCGASPVHNGHEDGDTLDLHFDIQETGFKEGDDRGVLIGEFIWPGGDDTRLIEAYDSVRVV